MVLIGNDNKKRLSWPIAKIIELIPGRDGEIRTVRLKTQHGTVIRPVQRIFPLEVQAIANSDKELKEESISVKSTKPEKVLNTNDAIVKKYTSSGRLVKELKRLDLLNYNCYRFETLPKSQRGDLNMESNLSNGTENELFSELVDVETQDYIPLEKETLTEQATLSNVEMTEILNDPENNPPKIDFDCIGEFCFESDQLALKGNNDYKNLLEAIVILEAQRAQAVKDMEKLVKMKEEALANPFKFLARIQRKEKLNFPAHQKIHPVPVIDWSKYALSGNPDAFRRRQMSLQRQMARDLARNNARAKLSTENKSSESNTSWSDEEQKKLKELLIQFPPEDVEANRWEKIANSLGTKSAFEVASRIHKKYTILAQDSEIALGKIPDLVFLQKEEDINNDPQYHQLIHMKKILKDKVLEGSSSLVRHYGYKCCLCKANPIIGVRWHCTVCQPPLSIDFCDDCSQSTYETYPHKANHYLEKIYGSRGFLDREYIQCLGKNYNYLDPNYMPATQNYS
ncbi:ZZ-type zinc finger-containing protein 3 [Trichonephila clavipes]|nr:ZZ-type zinc finger-containing protein 3 [Trichonephila clavipes]